MTDKQHLDAYLAGNRDALESLVRVHIDMVYATARRHVGGNHADDITQAVFIMLMRKCGGLRRRESVAGWLYGPRCIAAPIWRARRRGANAMNGRRTR